ncbi:extracellular solute-binding protein [Hespellia stercorisuis]|uniref:Multiple sugar transport system substrate-binding protein n=1 Tax=Hespellia stercorisuis DSM 15480 TaxID=1121950 RepID=A0A1M6M6J6_9FIRM|nr:extracellular solute-binding protein [Hespellia stercorisuis]SHJ79058.1 multiple sugar transport system substrate-binding protein [Hespellia stercorisuis DSM 15480]
MKKYNRLVAAVLAGILTIGCMACAGKTTGSTGETQGKSPLDPKDPTTIRIWNYYNGDQLTAFDELVSEFNSTVGMDEGIAVDSVSQGSIENLADSLLDAADEKIGAQDLPTMAAIYAETAYILEQKDLLVNLEDYFTAEELEKYVPGFIEEGRMVKEGQLLLFPVSKSTECFAVNKTGWADFEAATGITIDSVDSLERLVDVAGQYYEWSDSLTPDVAEDGKALFGWDSVANYIYIGAAQLGHELFRVENGELMIDLDRTTLKTLWDNYYIPYINGYFQASASHRSEDMKTGMILAMIASTSGISYLPTAVTDADDNSHDIEIEVKKPLKFAKGKEISVQQGADYCVIKSSEKEQYAAAEFLKWFTESKRNLQFSVASGYSAVTKEANDAGLIKENFVGTGDSRKDQNILNALLISVDVYQNQETYTTAPFKGSKDIRAFLESALQDTAARDREAVVQAIGQGVSREEATAAYSSDAYFDTWFDALCTSVKSMAE